MNNDEEGIHKVEQAQALFELVRTDIYTTLVKTTALYSFLRTNYHPKSRRLNEEEDFKESVYNLWGKLSTKVTNKIHHQRKIKRQSHYEPLLKLDDPNHQPTIPELYVYYRLLRDFVEDMGITKVENISWKYEPSHMALKGLVEDESRKQKKWKQ